MRHLSVTFPYRGQRPGSVYGSLVPHAPGRRASLYNFDILDDGTTIELVRVEGDIDDIIDEQEQRENLLDYEFIGTKENVHHIYQRVDQDSTVLGLLELLRSNRIMIDFPITYGEKGMTVRLVGPETAVQTLFDQLPQDVREELEVERIAEYGPESTDLRGQLTTRQLEVLGGAIDIGYYSFPREATIDDLARRLGISRSTTSEHLRRIEARVFGTLV